MFPRIYAILDPSRLDKHTSLVDFARELVAAGITLLQYRNKSGDARRMLDEARGLRQSLPDARLIMNDRADLCLAAAFPCWTGGRDYIRKYERAQQSKQ